MAGRRGDGVGCTWLSLRGSWRHWELSVPEPQASCGRRSTVGPWPRSLPYSVTAALEEPSLAPQGGGQPPGLLRRWSPHGPLSGFLAARLTLLTGARLRPSPLPTTQFISSWGPALAPTADAEWGPWGPPGREPALAALPLKEKTGTRAFTHKCH